MCYRAVFRSKQDNTRKAITSCTEPLHLQRCVVAEGNRAMIPTRSDFQIDGLEKQGITARMHNCAEKLHKGSHKGKGWDWSEQETMVTWRPTL